MGISIIFGLAIPATTLRSSSNANATRTQRPKDDLVKQKCVDGAKLPGWATKIANIGVAVFGTRGQWTDHESAVGSGTAYELENGEDGRVVSAMWSGSPEEWEEWKPISPWRKVDWQVSPQYTTFSQSCMYATPGNKGLKMLNG